MRACATWTAACCSSALAASLADSESMSTVEPSARVAPAEASLAGEKERFSTAVRESSLLPMAAWRAPWKSTSTRW